MKIVLYVAEDGNDSTGKGKSWSPWLTVEKAFDFIRKHRIENRDDSFLIVTRGCG